jgi:dephospho-CoA kinase
VKVLGLTGGIATGKSTFAERLRARGVPVLDADRLARDAVAPGSPGLADVAAEFGPDVVLPDGSLDRPRLAARVFADRGARGRLEAIVHPRVREASMRELARLAAAGAPLAVYDVPLLYEARREGDVDAVAVVWAPREAQIARLAGRDRLGREAAEARLAAQLPIDEKAARADFVVRNDGDLAALDRAADLLLADLAAGAGKRAPGAPPRTYP